jgi:hypothetical protein
MVFGSAFILAVALGVLALCLQVYCALCEGFLSRILSYVGVFLHVGMIVSFLFAKAELDLIVMLAMLSLLTYVGVHYFKYLRSLKTAESGEEGKE